MGRMQAESFAGEVAQGNVSLHSALVYHLQSNHYPPLPFAYVKAAERAIELYNKGQHTREVQIARADVGGITPRCASRETKMYVYVRAFELVRILHLEPFVEFDEEREGL